MTRDSRFFRIAGLTIRVEADLPITDKTFGPQLRLFEVPAAASADLLIRHHFELPGWKRGDLGEEVYRRPPWAVFRRGETWIYQSLPPPPHEHEPLVFCVFDHGYLRAEIYHADSRIFAAGGAESLSLLPTDQIVLGRTLADHQAFYLHAGGLVIDGRGLVFAGHSGAGKSTLVKMMAGQGTELLCDDRIVVRRWPDGFRVHGTWSHGEVPDVSPGESPLRGVFLLHRAAANRIVPLRDPREALRRLLPLIVRPLITADWWEKILAIVGEMVAGVPVFRLEFDKTGNVRNLLSAYAKEAPGSPAPGYGGKLEVVKVARKGAETQPYIRKVGAGRGLPGRRRPPLLTNLEVELTERCNNRCVHCYINRPADDSEVASRELDTATWKKILEEAAALGCLTVSFTGGEPLLRDDFKELYLFARRLGLRASLATNATRVTPRLASLLARIPPRERVEVSVYGLTRRTYEAVSRAPGSFAASQRGLRLLRKHGVPFTIKGALLRVNNADFGRFRHWAVDVSGDSDAGASVTSLYLRGRRDDPRRNARLRRLRLAPESMVRLQAAERTPFLQEMKDFLQRQAAIPGDRLFTCGAGAGSACVDSYGVLQMCLPLRHPGTVYDLRHGTLRDALEHVFPKLRELRTADPEYLRRCGRCFLQALCEQCPATAWMEHGTLDTPVEYFCDTAHALARALGLIGAREKAWDVLDWKKRMRGAPAGAHLERRAPGGDLRTARRPAAKRKEGVR